MKIQPMNLFATPETVDDIPKWIDLHPPEDRVPMYVVMGMTWNYLANAANKETHAHIVFLNDAPMAVTLDAEYVEDLIEATAKAYWHKDNELQASYSFKYKQFRALNRWHAQSILITRRRSQK